MILAAIIAAVTANAESIAPLAVSVGMWLRMEHRLTKLETTVRLLVTKNREPETET